MKKHNKYIKRLGVIIGVLAILGGISASDSISAESNTMMDVTLSDSLNFIFNSEATTSVATLNAQNNVDYANVNIDKIEIQEVNGFSLVNNTVDFTKESIDSKNFSMTLKEKNHDLKTPYNTQLPLQNLDFEMHKGISSNKASLSPANIIYTLSLDFHEYNIQYNTDGGKMPSTYPTTYTYDKETVLPMPTKEGYEFLGWSEEVPYTYSATSDWIKSNKGWVTQKDASAIQTRAPEGQSMSAPLNLNFTLTNSALIEFDMSFNATSYAIGNPYYKIYKNETLYKEYLLNAAGENVQYSEILEAGIYRIEIVGVYSYNTSTNETYDNTTVENLMISQFISFIPQGQTGDKTFTANWEAIPVYNILYNLNGGTLPEGAITSYTGKNEVVLPIPTKNGYEFLGWTEQIPYQLGKFWDVSDNGDLLVSSKYDNSSGIYLQESTSKITPRAPSEDTATEITRSLEFKVTNDALISFEYHSQIKLTPAGSSYGGAFWITKDGTSIYSDEIKAGSGWITSGVLVCSLNLEAGEYVIHFTGSADTYELSSDATGIVKNLSITEAKIPDWKVLEQNDYIINNGNSIYVNNGYRPQGQEGYSKLEVNVATPHMLTCDLMYGNNYPFSPVFKVYKNGTLIRIYENIPKDSIEKIELYLDAGTYQFELFVYNVDGASGGTDTAVYDYHGLTNIRYQQLSSHISLGSAGDKNYTANWKEKIFSNVWNGEQQNTTSAIAITDEVVPAGVSYKDVSVAQDGGVVSFIDGNVEKITTQRPGVKVKVLDCNNLFSSEHTGRMTLSSIDLTNLDTSEVKDMSYMFYGIDISELDTTALDTRSATNISNMFANCSSLTTLDLSNFDTSKVTDISSMFYGCKNLSTIINVTSESITRYSNMFTKAAENARIIVNYVYETNSKIVDELIATKSSNSNVVKGINYNVSGINHNATFTKQDIDIITIGYVDYPGVIDEITGYIEVTYNNDSTLEYQCFTGGSTLFVSYDKQTKKYSYRIKPHN